MKDIKIRIDEVLDITKKEIQRISYDKCIKEVKLGKITAYDTVSTYIDAIDNLTPEELLEKIDIALSESIGPAPYYEGVRLGYQYCKSLIKSITE